MNRHHLRLVNVGPRSRNFNANPEPPPAPESDSPNLTSTGKKPDCLERSLPPFSPDAITFNNFLQPQLSQERKCSKASSIGILDPEDMRSYLDEPKLNASRCSSMGILDNSQMSDLQSDDSSMSFSLDSNADLKYSLPPHLLAPSTARVQDISFGNSIVFDEGTDQLLSGASFNNPFTLHGANHMGDVALWKRSDQGAEKRVLTHADAKGTIASAVSDGSSKSDSSNSSVSCSTQDSAKTAIFTGQRNSSFGNLTYTQRDFSSQFVDAEFIVDEMSKANMFDEAEKQFNPNTSLAKADNSFANFSMNQAEVTKELSQSTYFMMSTSRLGSLESDENGRPPSDEMRPELGLGKIVSPKNKPFRVIEVTPEDGTIKLSKRSSVKPQSLKAKFDQNENKENEAPPSVSNSRPAQKFGENIEMSKEMQNIEMSKKVQNSEMSKEVQSLTRAIASDPTVFARAIYSSKHGGGNDLINQILQHYGVGRQANEGETANGINETGLLQQTQLLPSFLEATEYDFDLTQAIPQNGAAAGPQNGAMSATQEFLAPKPTDPKSRIPRLSPKQRRPLPPTAARHSSPMKKVKSNPGLEAISNVPSEANVDRPKVLPIASDCSVLVWIACRQGENRIQKVTIRNMLIDQLLHLKLLIRDSDQFRFSDNNSSVHEIKIPGSGQLEVAVSFKPNRTGWSFGKLVLKPGSTAIGPGLKAVVGLKGQCGVPDLILERFGQAISHEDLRGVIDFGEISFDSKVTEIFVKNSGNAAGFVKFQVLDGDEPLGCLRIEPTEFVVAPGNSQAVTFSVAAPLDSTTGGLYRFDVTIFRGSEICRQVLKILGIQTVKTRLGIEFNTKMLGEEDEPDDLKFLKTIPDLKKCTNELYKTTTKINLELSFIMKQPPTSFFALPVEETMNESQLMTPTLKEFPQVVVIRPDTIPEEEATDTNVGTEAKAGPSKPVVPSSMVCLDQEVIFFPPTMIDSASSSKVKIRNKGSSVVEFVVEEVSEPFAILVKHFSVKPKFSGFVTVHFMPTSAGNYDGCLVLRSKYGEMKAMLKGSTMKNSTSGKR